MITRQTGNRGGDEPRAYTLDHSIDGLGGMNTPLQVPCDRGGQIHGRSDRIACGSADPWPCIAYQSEWSLGRRPLHPAELAGAMAANEEEADGRWPRTFGALRFSTIVAQEPSQLDQTEYQSTVVYNTFEDMLRAHGHRVTASFLLCTLFCDTLGLPSGAYNERPRPLGWTQVVDHGRQLIRATNVRAQCVVLRLQGRRLYIGSNVQEFLVHLDPVWDERLTR